MDEQACTGHGRCYALLPEVFGADDEGHCVVLLDEVPVGLESRATATAGNCPEGAITVS